MVISGPSGVGKDAVIKALQASRPDLHFVVTATSRCALSYTISCPPTAIQELSAPVRTLMMGTHAYHFGQEYAHDDGIDTTLGNPGIALPC